MYEYTAADAKCRGLMGKALSPADYAALLKCGSVPAVALYLSGTEGYGEYISEAMCANVSRRRLEHYIKRAQLGDYLRLYGFAGGSGKAYLKHLLKRYENELLFQIWRSIGARGGAAAGEAYYGDAPLDARALGAIDSKLNTGRLMAAESAGKRSAFLEALKGSEYWEIFAKYSGSAEEPGESAAYIENALYGRYYLNLYKRASDFDSATAGTLKRLISAQADLINISRTSRLALNFGLPPERIFPNLIPVKGRLTREDLNRMAASRSGDEFMGALRSLYYGGRLLPEGCGDIEDYILDYMYAYCRKGFFRAVSGFASLVFYFFLREIEVKNLIRITEGKRYGIPAEEIARGLAGTRA